MRNTPNRPSHKTTRTTDNRTTRAVPAPRQPSLIGPDGQRIRLTDLPLVAYQLRCGCLGRAIAVTKGDWLFCEEHADRSRITKILA